MCHSQTLGLQTPPEQCGRHTVRKYRLFTVEGLQTAEAIGTAIMRLISTWGETHITGHTHTEEPFLNTFIKQPSMRMG